MLIICTESLYFRSILFVLDFVLFYPGLFHSTSLRVSYFILLYLNLCISFHYLC